MSLPDIDVSQLPPDWTDIRGQEIAQRALVELEREMPDDHRLRGTYPEAIAIRSNKKDLVVRLSGESPWGLVHLTGKVESEASWPWSETFASWSDLMKRLPSLGKII